MKKIAIITGASSGIGKEIFSSVPQKYSYDEIWCIARNYEALAALSSPRGKVVPISLDLTDNQAIERLSEMLEREKPVVETLINCSGYGKFGRTDEIPLSETLGMIDLNCRALTAVTHICLPYMHKGSGIIEIASIAGFLSIPYVNVYAASKAYVLSFSRGLRSELKKDGIRVTAVCPYWTKTAFLKRAAKGDEQVVKRYFALYDPKKVAKRAWRDFEKNKAVSSYGAFNKFLRFLCAITPSGLKSFVWKKTQGLK